MDNERLFALLKALEQGEVGAVPAEALDGLVRLGWASAGATQTAEDSTGVRERLAVLQTQVRAARGSATGLPPEDPAWQRVSDLEAEQRALRTRLLDAASQPPEGPSLTWRGRELLDELLPRLHRVAAEDAVTFVHELDGLKARLNDLAARAAPLVGQLDPKTLIMDAIEARWTALSLAATLHPAPAREWTRVADLLTARGVPVAEIPDLAALLVASGVPDLLLGQAGPVDAARLRVAALTHVGGGGSFAAAASSPIEVLAAALPADDTLEARRRELEAALRPLVDNPTEAEVLGLLLASVGTTAEATLQAWRERRAALQALHEGQMAIPAALLMLIDAPLDEVLDDLRMAAGVVQRHGLAITGVETLGQACRLLLMVAAGPPGALGPRLHEELPSSAPRVGLAALGPVRWLGAAGALLVDEVTRTGHLGAAWVGHRMHPAHRTSLFVG